MRFDEWIMSRKVTDTCAGDFVADTKVLIRAGRFPDVRTWSQLRHLLWLRGADSAIKSIGRYVWRRYEMECQLRPQNGTATLSM
jgi:hypothetical protein